jgi:HAD superfamily hydrolase (TIGR01549 family)
VEDDDRTWLAVRRVAPIAVASILLSPAFHTRMTTGGTHGDRRLRVVFFDVGDTLGAVKAGAFTAYPDTAELVRVVKTTLGLRVGVISNVPATMTTAELRGLLDAADILAALDPRGVITSRDAGAEKPDPRIYRYAAERMGTSVEQCLYVGEEPEQVAGAARAGMASLLKPKKED